MILLKCPDCREKFRWETANGWPRFCAICGADINNDREEIVAPAIHSAQAKSVDQVARGIMDGSEHRVQAAAIAAGCSPEEMSSLKITDLNDRKDATIAAIERPNEVTKIMADAPNMTGFQQGAGAAFAQQTRVGPYAGAGAKTVTSISRVHDQHVRALATSGKTR